MVIHNNKGGICLHSEVPVRLLKAHPKNREYYADLPEEKYQEIRKSIETHGIRDPLKILLDYTVVAGHQRLRIAQVLGMEKVPVVVVDISAEEAEYLLIADNEERRQADEDPIRKAKRAKFLAEYWEIKKGGDRGNQHAGKFSEVAKGENRLLPNTDIPKTLQEIANIVGGSERTLKELLKLNDLILPLQDLVSQKKLTRTAAYSLAFLSSEEQTSLLKTLGESGVCDLSGKDAQELRAELGLVREEKDSLVLRLAEIEEERAALSERLSDLQNDPSLKEAAENLDLQRQLEAKNAETEGLRAKLQSLNQAPIQKIIEIEKVVYQADPALDAELGAIRRQASELLKEKERIETRFRDVVGEKARQETALRVIKDEAEKLKERLAHAQSELIKEKERLKPPQWSKEHMDFRAAMESASQNAAALAAALARINGKHADLFLSVSRICGTSDDSDLDEAIEALGDTLLFRRFRSAIDAAAGRIVHVQEMLEPTKPKLQVVKK
jgi:ParB family chromosome partitioning protein